MGTVERRRNGLACISRCEIAAGKTQTITTHTELAVTLWVENGRVEVLRGLRGKPIATIDGPRPVPLGPGEVHVRNPGRSPVVVFAAMAELGAEQQAPAILLGPRARPTSVVPAAGRAGATGGVEVVRFHVLCDEEGMLTQDPVSHQEAEDLQDDHVKEFPTHPTRIRPASS